MTTYRLNNDKLKACIGFTPHENQQKIIDGQARFTCITAGRRFGKTLVASYLALRQLWLTDKTIWIAAPTYDLAKKTWRYLYGWVLREFPNMKINQANLTIENPATRSILELKTTENPASCIGSGVDFLIVDEASRVKEVVWQEALYPTLSDKMGKAFLISTPKGKNWFYRLYIKGRGEEPDYASFTFQTKDNKALPHLAEEQEKAKKELPENVYRQEYEAAFLEDQGQVFQGIQKCVDGVLEEPQEEKQYILGVDVAKYQDYTVVVVLDLTTFRVVGFERWNKLDWDFSRQKIEKISESYNNALIVIDSTGVGDPLAEALKRNGRGVEEYKYTNATKRYLIENLALKIQQGGVKFPNIQVLIDELEIFGYEYSPISRNVVYNAPEGAHDDCVNALALALYGAGHYPWSKREIKKPFPEGSYGALEQKLDLEAEERELKYFV